MIANLLTIRKSLLKGPVNFKLVVSKFAGSINHITVSIRMWYPVSLRKIKFFSNNNSMNITSCFNVLKADQLQMYLYRREMSVEVF